MTRNTVLLCTVALALAVVYVTFLSDWLRPPRIQIIPQIRPLRSADGTFPVSFTLDGSYRLTSIEVVECAAYSTNKHVAPIWHLVSRSNSVPTQGLTYGIPVRGMVPFVSNSTPVRLKGDVPYRLLLEAGRAKGSVDFKTREALPEQ